VNSRYNTGSILDNNGRGRRRNRPENRMRTQNALRLGLPSASPPQVPTIPGPGEDAVSYKQLDENTLILDHHTLGDEYE
jgi:hypothetical protein